MMNYSDFIKKIQQKIGEIHAADGIVESLWWDHVLRELNDVSIECARQLQNEPDAQPSGPQEYEKMPPSRLLALILPVTAPYH